MKLKYGFLLIILPFLITACSSTRKLQEHEYMLTKNSIVVKDKKSDEFDNLQYLIRPVTNRKFLFTNLRTVVYGWDAKVKKNGTTKEPWLKRKIGEPPVLLDSSQIDYSVGQLQLQLRKMGYFSPEISTDIVHRKSDYKKVNVNYTITVHKPHYVREIHYDIALPEFRRIILLDTANSLLKTGMQYNENRIIEERNRIANLIRDNGYYYVNNHIVTIEVDTINSAEHRNKNGYKTLSLTIIVNLDYIQNANLKERMLYKYQFDKVYIHTNYDLSTTEGLPLDTIRFISIRDKSDSTIYYFITQKSDKKKWENRIYRDFKYRTITDNIFTKKGENYSQNAYNKSYNRLRGLNNFSIINIEFTENLYLLDTMQKIGVLNANYKLTRSKLHSTAIEGSARSDKFNLAFSYSNKNLFKGAEQFTINLYGGYYYYNLFSNSETRKANSESRYYDIGLNASLSFPRLLFLKNVQKSDAIKYSTLMRAGINYNAKLSRLKINISWAYNWTPNNHISHSIALLNINTYDTTRRVSALSDYPQGYKHRFDKTIDFAPAYFLNYAAPFKNSNHNLRMSLNLQSSGFLIFALNEAFRGKRDWMFPNSNGYNYNTYVSGMLSLRYYYTINRKNSIATRLNLGVAVPYDFDHRSSNNYLPFENGFSVGGANSIRGWGYRLLGPGTYGTTNYLERTGDVLIEMNLEYRGSIWKAFKYGIFVDAGNIWLIGDDEGLTGGSFEINTFYKQFAVSAGVGLRLDFNFFLIRIDYGLPLANPGLPEGKRIIRSEWFKKDSGYWDFWQGFQIAIGHAF